MHANRAAEDLLRRCALIVGTGGMLGAVDAVAARELRAAIRLAASDETAIGRTGLAIRLTGPETAPVFAHVLPLTGSETRTRLQPTEVAAVFIGSPPEQEDAAEMLATIFDLTPAETRVLAGLVAGLTLAEAAAALGITRETAKSHLDRVFDKTDTRRQSDLVGLALRVRPPAGAAAG